MKNYTLITVLDLKNLWNIFWTVVVIVPIALDPSFETVAGCLTIYLLFNCGYYVWRRYVNSIGENIRGTGPVIQWIKTNDLKISTITHRRLTSEHRTKINAFNFLILTTLFVTLGLLTNFLIAGLTMIVAMYQSILGTIKLSLEHLRTGEVDQAG